MPEQTQSPSIRIIWELTVFAVLVLGANLAALLLSSPLMLVSAKADTVAMFLFSSAGIVGATYLVLLWFDHAPLRAIGIGFDRPWLRQTVAGFGIGAALITLVWLAFQLGGWLRAEFRPSAMNNWPALIGDVILFCAVAVYEELLCRGYAFQILYRRYKPLAFVLPGLLFVSLHLVNTGGTQPIALCNLFLAHVFLAVCYLRTRSLWFPIGIHAGWDVAMTVLGLPVSGNVPAASLFGGSPAQNALTGFAFGPEGGLLVTLVLGAATFAVWRFLRQRQPAVDLVTMEPGRQAERKTAAGEPSHRGESVIGSPIAGSSAPARTEVPQDRLPAEPALARPTRSGERVLAIDVLRGIAVLSILPMNMEIFALVPQAVVHPYAGLFTDSTNMIAWVALRVVIGSIGLSLFSLLFGAGLLLFDGARTRTDSPGESATALHYRRLAVLAVIGFAHAYLIWAGDILVTYAIVGSLIWLFRKRTPRALLTLGGLSFALPMLLLLGLHFLAPHLSDSFRAGLRDAVLPSAQEIAHIDEAYRSGWLGQMGQRFSDALANQTLNLLACMGWIAGGMMLLGMGLQKRGLLTAQGPRRTYWTMVAMAGLMGYPLLACGLVWCFRHEWQVPDGFFLGWAMRETAYPIIMMGWIGAVMLVCRAGALKPLTSRLAATGQMALTNYLVQSVLCHLIFYGTGLALADKLGIPAQIVITLAIWIAQLLYSPIWLARFRFGPAEWLWRSLSYGRWFELRSARGDERRAVVGAMPGA